MWTRSGGQRNGPHTTKKTQHPEHVTAAPNKAVRNAHAVNEKLRSAIKESWLSPGMLNCLQRSTSVKSEDPFLARPSSGADFDPSRRRKILLTNDRKLNLACLWLTRSLLKGDISRSGKRLVQLTSAPTLPPMTLLSHKALTKGRRHDSVAVLAGI